MEPIRIYGKTDLGTQTLTTARGALASPARQLLILVDGQRTVGELAGIFGADAVAQLLPALEQQGYVQFLRDGEDAGPPSRFADAADQAPAPAPAPAATPRNRLAVSFLAVGVLALSGALWWFLGTARGPAAPAATDAADASANAAANTAPNAPELAAAAGTPPAAAPPPAAPALPAPVPAEPAVARRAEARSAAASAAGAERSDARVPAAAPAVNRGAAPATPAVAGTGQLPARTQAVTPNAVAPPAAIAGSSTAGAVPSAPGSAAPAITIVPPPVAVATTAPAVRATEVPAPPAAPVPATRPTVSTDNGRSVPDIPRAGAASPVAAGLATNPPAPPVLHPRERTMPVLSRRARRDGIDSGQLVVRLHVTEQGTVSTIDVVKASPPQVYDSEIQQTLKKWTFDPPGVPVVTNVEFSFKP
jgi:TonB family protein